MKIRSINPRTGKIIKDFNEINLAEIQPIVAKAKLAQRKWASRPKKERIDIIIKLKRIIDREQNKIADIIYKEAGFSKSETIGEITDDILHGIDTHIEDYKEIETINYSNKIYQSEVQFLPQGVIGHIGIWNYPFWQTLITAIPALLTGNVIIYKPAEYTTIIGLKIAEMIWEAGVPKDVFTAIIGGPKIGQELVRADIDMIVFTGGIKTGNEIIKEAGTKPLLLELSGNDAGLVWADCDLQQTIKGLVYGSFLHSGEVCTRIKRIFVVRDISDKIIEGYVREARKLRIGKEISPLIRAEAREKVDNQVKEALNHGAKRLLGGKKAAMAGYYYEPTILLYENSKMKMDEDEIFGPVTLVQIVENEKEAINLANATNYGLGATIWSKDIDKAKKVAEKLEVGMVWINDSNVAIPGGVYYGGVKGSGIASSESRIQSFMKKKMIISNPKAKIRDWWY